MRVHKFMFVLIAACAVTLSGAPLPATFEPGLQAVFRLEDGERDTEDFTTAPNLWLYVPEGQPPTPFVSAGRFSAVWTGFLSLDIRSEYAFSAEISGELKLELNGTVVLEGKDGSIPPGKPIRLNKGANRLSAVFRAPQKGDAFVRVLWTPKGTSLPSPIPLKALSHHGKAPELIRSELWRRGRDLIAGHRCLKCHTGPAPHAQSGPGSGMLELLMDAPSFEGIGSRRNPAWLADWIADPKAQRMDASMPRVFHGATARADAEAAAAFLASLKEPGSARAPGIPGPEIDAGAALFANLHCAACHDAIEAEAGADAKRSLAEPESRSPSARPAGWPGKIPLRQVNRKFSGGTLESFLRQPDEHYAWTRMPNFRLTEAEAGQLAAYLRSIAEPVPSLEVPAREFEPGFIARGKALVQSSGCLNCHALKLENLFSTRTPAELPEEQWTDGCVAEAPAETSRAPWFGLNAEDRAALRAFAATDRLSLSRHVPSEFAERQIRNLNCAECHGQQEGFPPIEILGGKLKPEWSRAFIAGEIPEKPRPWLAARMPSFARHAGGLAHGMAMRHGYPPMTTAEPDVDLEMAKAGQQLVSANGGFACVACHGVAQVAATQVFESAGTNLAYSRARLLKDYYRRWLFNPIAIDPTTKMPVYFDEEGKSPLTEFYEGDGGKQIEALWHYLGLGDRMPPPAGTEPAP